MGWHGAGQWDSPALLGQHVLYICSSRMFGCPCLAFHQEGGAQARKCPSLVCRKGIPGFSRKIYYGILELEHIQLWSILNYFKCTLSM